MIKSKVVVIGGGPAGMMAAGIAGGRGLDVTLIEKNADLGRKLLITGKGRCNITNNADIKSFIENTPVNGKFLYKSFNSFTNVDLIHMLNELGLKTKVERGGRVFPESDRSVDVLRTIKKLLHKNDVKIIKAEVVKVTAKSNKISSVLLKDGRILQPTSVIIATGGLSYPHTGSTGDGYQFARKLGHTIKDLKPSLVPLETIEKWVRKAMGLTLKNVSIEVVDKDNKKIYKDFGEMSFTEYGVAGPVILSASSYIREIETNQYKIYIDLKPALKYEQLDGRIQRDFEKYSSEEFKTGLKDLLPSKMIPIIVSLSGIPSNKKVNQITRDERKRLVESLKKLKLTVKSLRPIDEAIITSGGVNVKEIDPGTMESKIIKGLYFAGEIIDVDAYTGGFNLQIAFSTGYLAGMSCK